ncbi:hypothetical protein SmJEL517_g01950 [Synchytrium microbalum]|uniref:Peptidase M20 dimerisation domain-containing protein n=1 Tax=Synchytrium microbalum TaxID=1806994 RepID=A0A507C807_9FUNG|nr:uncharacterized protein SmJEL517_g01950 [Synchytrium microbalum]TPX35742.1 hypothetical protein SmJEL517_g01950 [Synchytrium microbalum]
MAQMMLPSTIASRIPREVTARYNEMVATRRELHANPELGYEEVETAKLIVQKLQAMKGLEIFKGVGQTGVVALMRGKRDHPCILLRADMDCLGIDEDPSKYSFVSRKPGRMHACGHDGHVAMLLAAAEILTEKFGDRSLNGSIKFMFQPAEEGGAGAKAMIDDGLFGLGGIEVDEVYGLHLGSNFALGDVLIGIGPVMAGSDAVDLTVQGVGGHGAYPHLTKDAVLVQAAIVQSLHTIVSRNVAPDQLGVLTIGHVSAGSVRNAVASKATLLATVRTVDAKVQSIMKKRITEVAEGVAHAHGCKCQVDYTVQYPATINVGEGPYKLVQDAAAKIVGKEHIRLVKTPQMGSEDFSFLLLEKPGNFFFVGAAPTADLGSHPHHSPLFDFNEQAMLIGSSIFVELIEQRMNLPMKL